MDREIRSFPLTELRFTDDGAQVLEGHAAVFNVKSHDLGFREIIRPGAFATAVTTDDVRFLVNHRGLPLARTRSGTLKLTEDTKGLAFRASLDPTDPDVARLIPKVKRGDLSEMSFAFAIKDRETDERWYREGNEMIRSIAKVTLYDVSAVSFPAYPSTDLNARSYFEQRMAEVGAADRNLAMNLAMKIDEQRVDAIITQELAAEKKREDFDAMMRQRQEFLDRRRSPSKLPTLDEIYRNARRKAV